MTVPTVVLGAGVVYLWGPSAIRAVRKGALDAQGWFIVGVVVAFIGAVLDNLYWSVPWAASYLGLEVTGALMSSGVYFNIFFRQASGILAAYCHLRAAAMSGEKSRRWINYLMALSNILACLFITIIWYVRAS